MNKLQAPNFTDFLSQLLEGNNLSLQKCSSLLSGFVCCFLVLFFFFCLHQGQTLCDWWKHRLFVALLILQQINTNVRN